MRSLSSKPSDGFGDMDRKSRIACREHLQRALMMESPRLGIIQIEME